MAENKKFRKVCFEGTEVLKELSIPVQTDVGLFGNAVVALGHFPVAAEIKSIKVYNVTKAGGTPVLIIGTAADDNAYVTSVGLPANNTVLTCTLVTTAIVADTEMIVTISGGTTSDPVGVLVRVQYVEQE